MIFIPVGEAASQIFVIVLEGRPVTMTLRFQALAQAWYLGMEVDGEVILGGQRMVTGTNMLAAFNFNLGALFCMAGDGPGVDPGREDFEERVKFVHVSEAEIAAVSS